MSRKKSQLNQKILGANLRLFRKKLGLNQSEFAKPLGITNSSISAIEQGKNSPAESTIKLMEKEYQLNRHWLFTGEGDPYRYENQSSPSINDPEESYNHRPSKADEPHVDDFATAVALLQEIWGYGDNGIIEALQANLQTLARTVRKERQLDKQSEKTQWLEERISKLEKKLETKEAPGDKRGAA